MVKMKQFPDPIIIPKEVFDVRKERLQELMSSCLKGIGIRAAIILAEFTGVIWLGSSSLMMDALASLIDILSSILLVISIRFAAKPPDEHHPFGHGRFEPLVGLQLGIFMGLIGIGMLLQQIFAVSFESEGKIINAYLWVIPFCAVILLELSYQIVMHVSKKQNSPALAADAIHYRIDGITSLCAAIALIAGSYYPALSVKLDHFGAIFIAVLMVGIGIYILRQNLHQILDRIPDRKYFELVSNAAKRVEGVHETEKIRIQVYGPDAHVDIDIEVDPLLSVEIAHVISQKVRAQIQKEWPLVQDVTVHIEPYYPNDH